MHPIVCFESLAGPFGDIQLVQTGLDNFTVKYGRQVKHDLNYSAAAQELGACLMHRAACDGQLDNSDI